ncbi:MAG: hypothetical protein WC224_07495 [Sphaerochaetaceae bacterium]|jgi:hypothetical protein
MLESYVRLTVILRHDQSKTLDELDAHLFQTGFWDSFPPEGAKIISWQVAIGLGHVIVIEIPSQQIRPLNLIFEKQAWGAFKTDCYIGYDFLPFIESKREQGRARSKS